MIELNLLPPFEGYILKVALGIEGDDGCIQADSWLDLVHTISLELRQSDSLDS